MSLHFTFVSLTINLIGVDCQERSPLDYHCTILTHSQMFAHVLPVSGFLRSRREKAKSKKEIKQKKKSNSESNSVKEDVKSDG